MAMYQWNPSKKVVHLPTVLKYTKSESVIELGSEEVGRGLEESTRCYKAVERNKRQLVRDSSTISGRHLDAFSLDKIISQTNMPRISLEVPSPSTVVRLFDPGKIVQMPGARMPETQRQNDPPPLYSESSRGQRSQQPPRYRESPPRGTVYVYYPPEEREPVNTRDYGPYRSGYRNPAHRLVDRQTSSEYLFEKRLRKIFVCKVYLMLSMLLAFSFVCCLITSLVTPIKLFFITYWWISIIFLFLYLGFSIALMCSTQLRRSFPTNLILLFCMCLCITVPMCVATAFYSTKTVLLALGTTVLITVTISVLAKVSPFDVTGCGMLVCILALVFSLYGMITFIVSLFIYEPLMSLIYGAIGTVLFSFFLFFDTQQILGGRRVELSPEEYILGVVLLYIDIIMIFLMLLNVYGYAE